MTTERLREELARIGTGAPAARVDPGTWGRARRVRRRERVLGVVGAVAAVAVVAGVGLVLLPSSDDRAPVAAGGPGVPDRLYAVPARMAERGADDSWRRAEVTGDLAIGRGAAAWVMREGLPVVVDADDGDYHLLDLPGFSGNDMLTVTATHTLGLALSPDGRQLAYGYGDPGPADDDTPVPSGVRVVDLETGTVRDVPLTGGEGTLVTRIRFSPDGTWVVWSGDLLNAWTQGQLGGRIAAAGRIAPGAVTSEPVMLPGGLVRLVGARYAGDLAIDDSGVVVALAQRQVARWDGTFLGRHELDRTSTGPLAVGPDGAAVLSDGRDLVTVDPATGRTRGAVPADGAEPLRWNGDGVVAVTTDEVRSPAGVVLVGPDDVRRVATVDGTVASLSIATDLVTAERPSVSRPAPDWPWSDEARSAAIGLWVAVAVALGLGLRLLWRRSRRHRPA